MPTLSCVEDLNIFQCVASEKKIVTTIYRIELRKNSIGTLSWLKKYFRFRLQNYMNMVQGTYSHNTLGFICSRLLRHMRQKSNSYNFWTPSIQQNEEMVRIFVARKGIWFCPRERHA